MPNQGQGKAQQSRTHRPCRRQSRGLVRYTQLILVVEADSVQSAIDELADSEKFGHLIAVDEADLGDYPEDDRHYGPSGQVIGLDHVMIHGQEGVDCPFPCRYFGDDLPSEGLKPTDFYRRDDDD